MASSKRPRQNNAGISPPRAKRKMITQPLSSEHSIVPFLRLPPELRNNIYSILLRHSEDDDAAKPAPIAMTDDVLGVYDSPLFLVSRQVRQEALSMYYSLNTFSLNRKDFSWVSRFLRHRAKDYLHCLAHVVVALGTFNEESRDGLTMLWEWTGKWMEPRVADLDVDAIEMVVPEDWSVWHHHPGSNTASPSRYIRSGRNRLDGGDWIRAAKLGRQALEEGWTKQKLFTRFRGLLKDKGVRWIGA
ncbi:hypothetical protein H2203_005939 [Taxawa tesnikishii (nom. ined.)]|nr:hypothetical protein H2203_005939 [Dothideales sp. JES 119]